MQYLLTQEEMDKRSDRREIEIICADWEARVKKQLVKEFERQGRAYPIAMAPEFGIQIREIVFRAFDVPIFPEKPHE